MNKQLETATEVPGKLFASSLNPSSCNKSTQTFHEGYIFSGNHGKQNMTSGPFKAPFLAEISTLLRKTLVRSI